MFTLDTLVNFVSGLGTAKDKNTATAYTLVPLTDNQLSMSYRGDWVARKVVNIPAQDATSKWRSWQATKPQIEKLEELEKNFSIKRKVKSALVKARLYGGGALVMGFNEGNPAEPLDLERVTAGSLKFVHVVGRTEVQAGNINRDITSEFYGEPENYTVQPLNGSPVTIHPSRVVRFIGAEFPDINMAGGSQWGDSILQALDDAVKNVGLSSSGIAILLQEAKMDVVKIPNFMASISTKEYKDRLMERLSLANTAKGLLNTILMDKEEDWERITTSFAGLPDILKLYLLIACGAADIPATRFIGQSAAGLNATGEGDLRNYYDNIANVQTDDVGPPLTRLDEVLIRSALGTRDKAVWSQWNPLWQMDSVQKATVSKSKADAYKIDVDAMQIDPEVLGKARINQLIEDGTYPGLDQLIEESENEGLNEEDPAVKEQFQAGKGVQTGQENNSEETGSGEKNPEADKNENAETTDSEPRTLYVRRDVLNGGDIVAWAKAQGFETTLLADDMHVTIAFSRMPVDWMKMGQDWSCSEDGKLTVPPGGPRMVDRLGAQKEVAVLLFSSSTLCWRHESMKEQGATWDWPEYQPHITVSYKIPEGMDVSKLEPYRGVILLGTEIFEEVKVDWKNGIEEE
jgi:phage-related protein (TIGR01555 family)